MSAVGRLFGWLADRYIQLLFIAAGLVMTIGGSFWYLAERRAQTAAASWATVTGRVIESRIAYSPGGRARSGERPSPPSYGPYVTYSYQVGGRSYRSENIWVMSGESFGTWADAEAFLEPYRPGATVTVHYDPANPGNAALIVGKAAWPILVLAGTGLIFVAIGWFFLRV